MSQRNPQNARYKEGGKKNVTRKSAGRAKPKSAAAGSVYIKGQNGDKNQGGFLSKLAGSSSSSQAEEKEKEKKERQEARLNRKDTRVVQQLADMPGYTTYRNRWIALIVVAVVGVALSFGVRYLLAEDNPARNALEIAGLVIGYGGLIAALIVDFKCMRPIRKAYQASASGSSGSGTVHKESKKELKHRQEREAEEAARKANKKSLFGRKKD